MSCPFLLHDPCLQCNSYDTAESSPPGEAVPVPKARTGILRSSFLSRSSCASSMPVFPPVSISRISRWICFSPSLSRCIQRSVLLYRKKRQPSRIHNRNKEIQISRESDPRKIRYQEIARIFIYCVKETDSYQHQEPQKDQPHKGEKIPLSQKEK